MQIVGRIILVRPVLTAFEFFFVLPQTSSGLELKCSVNWVSEKDVGIEKKFIAIFCSILYQKIIRTLMFKVSFVLQWKMYRSLNLQNHNK